MVPVYLQMTLGLDALQTGIRIFPLSISLILFSIFGTRLSRTLVAAPHRPRRAVDPRRERRSCCSAPSTRAAEPGVRHRHVLRGRGARTARLAARQRQHVGVTAKDTSEVGGLQGVFQNLGSSLGTALIGSVLIGALATSFATGVAHEHAARRDPGDRQRGDRAAASTIVPAATVPQIADGRRA